VTEELLEQLRETLLEGMQCLKIPGVAIGLLEHGHEHVICEGITSVTNPLPVTPETLFQIGSTTKTITGTIIMRLLEMGKLELEAPVRKYLPELKLEDESVAAQVRVRQLLNHTGGWVGDLFTDTGEGDDALAKYVQLVAGQAQITPLGEVWHYNNSAFGVVGRLIEVITGQTYERAAKELLLEPLGLTHSNFFAHEAMIERFAVGHFLDESDELQISKPWAFARAIGPIGRLNSSVLDQLKYARFHLEGNTGVLSDANRLEMQRPTVKGQLGDEFGVTWWINDATGERIVSHGGATNGQMSAFWFVPTRGFACTVLTNADKGGFLHNELSAWIREQMLGLQTPVTKPLELSTSQLEEYAGTYVGRAFGTTIELEVQSSVLVRTVNMGDLSSVISTPAPPIPPARCELLEGDLLQVLEGDSKGSKHEFLRDATGRIEWLRAGGRVYAKT
jgi:CubicO group peptidase (beta-lactamase class C family)